MTATQGQARCGSLVLLQRVPEEESWIRGRLLECAEAFSPDFEDTAAGVVTVDLLGVRAAPEGVGAQMVRRLGDAGISVYIGVAEDPDLALLAAKVAAGVREGDRVKVGETVLARIPGAPNPSEGASS